MTSKINKPMPRLGRGLSSLISNSVDLPPASDQEYRHVTGLPPVQGQQPASDPPAHAVQPDPAAGIPVPMGQPSHSQPDMAPVEVDVTAIMPNPYQPRREFDAEQLNELAASIAQQGVIQPIIVAPASPDDGGKAFVVVAGERRLRAARLAGLKTIPCVVRQASRQQMLEWALVENIQRADLNPVERAHAYRDFMDRFQLTQVEAAQRLGQPRTTVANYIRVLDLCDEVQQMLVAGHLSFGHAKVLAGLANQPEKQQLLARKAVAESLSVRQLENLATAVAGPEKPKRPKVSGDKPPYLADLEDQLTRTVGTKVAITPGKAKHSGKILIDYYSLDDFDRITTLLGLRIDS